MVPKLIHIVWVGDKPQPQEIESWSRMNPDYEVQVWGNDSLARGWRLAEHMAHFWERELCGVADCMRWEILYEFGGIAMDADSECVRPLEDWLLEPDAFACWENEIARPGLIANGIVGTIPQHPLIGQIIQDLVNDAPHNRMAWQFSGPARLTETIHKHKYHDLTVYPSHYFLPDHFSGASYQGKGQIFARQGWSSTRGSK